MLGMVDSSLPLAMSSRNRHLASSGTRTLSAATGGRRRSATAKSKPVYYNPSTLHLFPNGPSGAPVSEASGVNGAPPRRIRRLGSSSSRLYAEDSLPMDNTSTVDESDPYKGVRIFRRDMLDSHGSKSPPLSLDVSYKKFIDMFCDFESKRCKLCNETILQWHTHQGAIPHAGREGVLLELVRAYCGTPDEILKMWWHRLHTSMDFQRIPTLSHNNSHVRKRRLQFLLRFLKDRQIIKDTFNVQQSAAAGAGRTWEFERLEWVGDNVIKYLFSNRLNCVFPVREGGIRGKLGYAQFMIDGNDGLARAYDYLELQLLTQSDRVVSKFKSDVVETLFGELQLYLWATEVDAGTEYHAVPFTPAMHSVRAIVAHVMEELAHVMFMYHAEYLNGCLQRVVRENQLQFVRTDPALRGNSTDHSSNDHRAAMYAKRAHSAASNKKLSSTRVPHINQGGSGSALFMESVNYDAFKRVVSLGGLLPRPFAVDELAATPTFMPHLQVAPQLTERVKRGGLGGELGAAQETPQSRRAAAGVAAADYYGLSSSPRAPPEGTGIGGDDGPNTPARLGIPELKDEDLITELI